MDQVAGAACLTVWWPANGKGTGKARSGQRLPALAEHERLTTVLQAGGRAVGIDPRATRTSGMGGALSFLGAMVV